MEWIVRQPAAEDAFNAWLDIDHSVDVSLAGHVRNWLENDLATKGPDQGLTLYDDGERRTILVPQTRVRVTFRVDRDRNEIDIRSIGRPSGGGSDL